METEPDQAEAQRLADRLRFVEMLPHLGAGLVERPDRSTRELELAARLERDRALALGERDQVLALVDGIPAEAILKR